MVTNITNFQQHPQNDMPTARGINTVRQMSKRGMFTVKELMQPVGWRAFGAMLWWAFYCVSVIEIAVFAFRAIGALFFGKKVFWDRELTVLVISVVVVVCYHTIGRKKKPNQPPEPTPPSGAAHL